ncbi:MAG: hypothetical protein LBM77_06545 [Spirochaetaceae bacterium]|jgi:Sec-independent protein translocase protein TatA|nr:hypothetical protein [Spirochaetaceae bacterium]
MAEIKSALDIALERASGIKADSGADLENEKQGKKIANLFMNGEAGINLADELKKYSGAALEAFKHGCFEALLGQLGLPNNVNDAPRQEAVAQGLDIVLGQKKFSETARQYGIIIKQYCTELQQYDAALKQQYAPKLRQKEEMLSRQLGQPVRLDPFQDPEFQQFYKQSMDSLKEHYRGLIGQVREAAENLFSEGE